MANRRPKPQEGRAKEQRPKEIPMTDLDWPVDGEQPGGEAEADIHAAGTPGGGTASGGLAGSNIGSGDPDNADLEGALGSGTSDTGGEEQGGPPYAGEAGGAVGGTPAEKRAKGGRRGSRLSPGPHRGESTIGGGPGKGK